MNPRDIEVLPGYLRALIYLYAHRRVSLKHVRRRELGFDKNSISMLKAYGYVRVEDGWAEITEKGIKEVEKLIKLLCEVA